MRCAPIRTGAVLVCLAAGASCSDDNDVATVTTAAPSEPATTPAADPVTAAEEIAQGFADAWGDNDVDRALPYLSDYSAVKVPRGSFEATSFASLDELRRWSAAGDAVAMAADWIVEDCEQQDNGTDDGINFHCGYAFHAFGSDAIGLGPYGGNYLDITVRDGKVVSAVEVVDPNTNGLASEMWWPFAGWLVANHPDDVLVMFATADGGMLKDSYSDDEIRVWAQRVEEYVQVVLTRREAYPGEVSAICATQATRLGELAVPAEGALDQIAAWYTAAAGIIDQAHGELTALDEPPSTDTQVYTNFYGRLARFARITEESAQAATANDTTRLTELDTEYREVRGAMNSGPTESGLEACLASLPS
jgi:hypothetical protein